VIQLNNKRYVIDWIAIIILIIGGLNWGLVGLFSFNLVDAIFGIMSVVSRIIYILVGISAVYIAIVSPNLIKD
jgi:hypothetical protein